MKCNQSGSDQKYVLSTVSSGLCNRLKNLMTVIRIAEDRGRIPAVYWPKNPEVCCDFSELFKNKIEIISKESELKNIYKTQSWREYRHYPEKDIDVDYLIISSWRLLVSRNELSPGFAEAVPSMSRNDIDFEYQRIPDDIRKPYVDLIKRLEPLDYLTGKIEEIAEQFDDGTVSVHIRSWVDAQNRSEQVFDFAGYVKVMDRFGPDQRFFISCDTESVLSRMIGKYGSRIIYFPKEAITGDRATTLGIQEALVDLYLLAKNKTIITSYMSTFSEFAWWLGSCSADVHVVGGGGDIRDKITLSDVKKRRALLLKNTFYRPYLNLKGLLAGHAVGAD
jgi:hypothetical protein